MILVSVGPGLGALSTPGIACELSAAGHRVEVVLEPRASRFIGPGAFAGCAAVVDGAPDDDNYRAVLYAPADAGVLARLARGLSEPPGGVGAVFIAPEVDGDTSAHPAVLENLASLRDDGCRIIPGSGGRMAPAEEIVAGVLGGLGGPLGGCRVLVTAGGTREPIDSVRFVGNRSSGKMGKAIAREALRMGAEVSVVAANVEEPEPGVGWVAVETVEELEEATLKLAAEADVLAMAAAVSDFTPARRVEAKIRRRDGLKVEFVPTDDILKAVRQRYPDLFMVGFAATHGDPVPDAREKLESKGADLVVGNDISRSGVGFGADENEVYIVGQAGEQFVPRTSKSEVARAVLEIVAARMSEKRRG